MTSLLHCLHILPISQVPFAFSLKNFSPPRCLLSSSSNVQKDGDVEMSDAAGASLSVRPAAGERSLALPTAGAVSAHIAEFLSFQSEMARCEAEKKANPTCDVSPRPEVPAEALSSEVLLVCDTVPAGGAVAKDVSAPGAEVQSSGSSTTLIRVVVAEPAPESIPPPTKRSIVVGLSAPNTASAVLPKSLKRSSANPDAAKKRKCVEAGPLPTKASGLGLASRYRAKVCFERKLLSFLACMN